MGNEYQRNLTIIDLSRAETAVIWGPAMKLAVEQVKKACRLTAL